MVNMGGSQESVNTHNRRPVYRPQTNRQPVYEPEKGQSEHKPVYVAAPDELAKRSGPAGGHHHQAYDSHGQYQQNYAPQTQARHPVRGTTAGLYPPFRQANERSGLLNFKRRISDQWDSMHQFLDEKAAQVFPRTGPHTAHVFTERPYSLWIVAAIIVAAIAIPTAISIATIQNRAEIKAQEKREEIPVLPEPVVTKKVEEKINGEWAADFLKEQQKLIALAEANNKIDDVITDQEDEDAALDPDYVVVDAENDYQTEELDVATEQAETTTTVGEIDDAISRSSLPKISTSSPEECKAKCEEMDDCNVWIWRDDLKGETEEENVKDSIVDVVKEIVSGAGASEDTPLETESEETAVDPAENEKAETTSQEALATTAEEVVEEETTTILASDDVDNVETTVLEAVVTTVKSIEEETTPELTTAQTTAATTTTSTTTTTTTTTTSTTTTTTNVPTTVPKVETTVKPAELVENIEEAVDNIVGSITDIVGSVTNIVESVTEQPSEDSNTETTTVKVAKKSKRSVKSLRLGRSSGQCEFYFSNEPATEELDEENVVSGIVNRK